MVWSVRATAFLAAAFACGEASAQDRAYNDPTLVGARFTFDPTVWRMSPPNPTHGGCSPEPFPKSARCQMAFRVNGNPDGRKDTAAI